MYILKYIKSDKIVLCIIKYENIDLSNKFLQMLVIVILITIDKLINFLLKRYRKKETGRTFIIMIRVVVRSTFMLILHMITLRLCSSRGKTYKSTKQAERLFI